MVASFGERLRGAWFTRGKKTTRDISRGDNGLLLLRGGRRGKIERNRNVALQVVVARQWESCCAARNGANQ